MRKELFIASHVAVGFAFAIAALVQPAPARNDSNEKECRLVDKRSGLVTTICSAKAGSGWKVTVATHNGSRLGKGFTTRCLPGSDETIAHNFEAFRLEIDPGLTVHRFASVDSRERPKVDCKAVRVGDNFSDQPEYYNRRGHQAYKRGDLLTALQMWKPLAEQGDFDLQFALGKVYLSGQNYAEAFKWFRRAAEQGDRVAAGYLGVFYANGEGVGEDKSKALHWFRFAAEEGDAYGQYILGELYDKAGLGLPQNHVLSAKWYRLAVEQGNASGQNNLGFAYEMGQGVQRDYVEAVKWYRLAVEQDHAFAQNNLGYMYEHGQGVGQDHVEALKLYRRSAEQNNPYGQRSLGHMYESGLGVKRDDVQAYKWFSLAFARLPSSDEIRELADDDRARVAMNMTPAQIAEAEKLAAEWKSSK